MSTHIGIPWLPRRLLAALLLCFLFAGQAAADPVYLGGNGGTSFGVTSYGAPTPGVPTYILNNFTGLTDILASPGGTFLTANPVLANNISSTGVVGLPYQAFQAGGGNGNGPFGAGQVINLGPLVGFTLQDVAAGSGSASYSITSWNASFIDPLGSAGIGTFLSLGGLLPDVNGAAVAALRTRITSANLGVFDLPQLVLAIARIGPLAYSFVALGGPTGLNAAVLVDNAVTGAFRALAINNLAIPIPAGDVLTVTSTLTVYADPSMMTGIFPDLDLITATGTTLSPTNLVGIGAVPEPGSATLVALAGLLMVGYRRRCRKEGDGKVTTG